MSSKISTTTRKLKNLAGLLILAVMIAVLLAAGFLWVLSEPLPPG